MIKLRFIAQQVNGPIMPVLCVIDVQSDPDIGYAPARSDLLIERILEEISIAKKRGHIITITEFNGAGCTNERLLDAVKDYPKTHYTFKDCRDGSLGLSQILQKYSQVATERISVCGVYTHYCVRDTATGLAHKMPWAKVTVLEDASNDNFYEGTLSQRLSRKRQTKPHKTTPKNLKTRKRRLVSSCAAAHDE